jgi:hypothetical protein
LPDDSFLAQIDDRARRSICSVIPGLGNIPGCEDAGPKMIEQRLRPRMELFNEKTKRRSLIFSRAVRCLVLAPPLDHVRPRRVKTDFLALHSINASGCLGSSSS